MKSYITQQPLNYFSRGKHWTRCSWFYISRSLYHITQMIRSIRPPLKIPLQIYFSLLQFSKSSTLSNEIKTFSFLISSISTFKTEKSFPNIHNHLAFKAVSIFDRPETNSGPTSQVFLRYQLSRKNLPLTCSDLD